MPTIKEASAKRQSYAWMISRIMEEKERSARERLNAIHLQQPALKAVYEEYLHLYNLHIKPLMPKVEQYFSNIHEKRKIEHFLQAQADHLKQVEADKLRPIAARPKTLGDLIGVERLPYADDVGKKPKKQRALNHDDAKELMKKLKALDPQHFSELLKKIGGK